MSEEIIKDAEVTEEKTESIAELESPLVVHKKGDASYKESKSYVEMNETHAEDDSPTLNRHRFRKEHKGHRGLIIVLVIIVVFSGVFAALYYTGNIRFTNQETTKTKKTTQTETVTSLEEQYKNTIVVKDTYIFVDGVEVDGIQGLQKALEYEDKSTTAYTIIDENANNDFLNFEVLQILQQMGFYGSDTVITHKESTGLIAYEETTTLPPETTESTSKKAKKTTTKENND